MDQEAPAVPTNVYGDVCVRKQRKKRQKLLIVELFNKFANYSTLHGLRYIIDRSLHLIEKIFWLITFLMSVGMCFYLINRVWNKWELSPVIVSVSEELVSVGVVPFPSVTICPQTKCKLNRFNFSMYALNSTKDEDNKYDDLLLVCNYLNENIIVNVTNDKTVKNIIDVAPTLKDVIIWCKWQGKFKSCNDIFDTVLTGEGVCFNFNGLAADEMFRENSIHNGYNYTTRTHSDINDAKSYPRRGRGNGASPDLSILLRENITNSDKVCNVINSGYKIYVQHPSDIPQSSVHYFAALHSTVSSLALSVNIMNTSESLKDYPVDIRQCYFSGERTLRYYKIYTASNCRLECWSNFTYERCGCYWFSMPHNDSNNICTQRRRRCVVATQDRLAQGEIRNNDGSDACNCLPACDSVEYDADVLKTEFNFKTKMKYLYSNFSRFLDSINLHNYSSINLYYKKPSFVSMRRSELFGWVDFLANCGGLLSLFLGFSFLSLVEIFYFLTLRLCCTLKKDLQEEKRNKQERIDTGKNKLF